MIYTPEILLSGVLIAFIVGILTGVFGIGGGFLMTPALMIFLSIPCSLAVGTDLATILATSSFGIFKRKGTGTVDVKLAGIIGIGSMIGVLVGSSGLEMLRSAPKVMFFGKERDVAEYTLLCLFFLLLVWIAVYIIIDHIRSRNRGHQKRETILAKIKLPPCMYFLTIENSRISVLPLVILGCAIGVLTGLMGVGGGILMLPVLIYIVGQHPKKAAGTSLLVVWIASLIGTVHKGYLGHIAITLWMAMIIGGIAGVWLGTRIGLGISGPKLRVSFVYVVIGAVLLVGYQIYTLTF